MKRVKSFKIGSNLFKVKYVKNIEGEDDEIVYGHTNYPLGLVKIRTHLDKKELSEDAIEHALFHEVSHIIMNFMGENELNANETFIDLLGLFFHQFIKTSK